MTKKPESIKLVKKTVTIITATAQVSIETEDSRDNVDKLIKIAEEVIDKYKRDCNEHR